VGTSEGLDPGVFVWRNSLCRQLTANPIRLLRHDYAKPIASCSERRRTASQAAADDDQICCQFSEVAGRCRKGNQTSNLIRGYGAAYQAGRSSDPDGLQKPAPSEQDHIAKVLNIGDLNFAGSRVEPRLCFGVPLCPFVAIRLGAVTGLRRVRRSSRPDL